MCGVRYGRPPFGVAALFLRQRGGGAVQEQCVRAVCSGGATPGPRRIFASDFCARFRCAFRRAYRPLFRSAFRCEFQCAFRPSFLPACEAALRGLLWKKASRRGVGWGFFGGVPSPKKDRLPEGKRSCALKRRNRRVVPRVLSRRLCYRSLLTSCCTRDRVASGLEAGRAEPVSSLTGDAPSRLTVRLLRKTGPKFPAASFATARK